MKTQEQLSKMTDQELTFELACLVFGEDEVYAAKHGKVAITIDSGAKYFSINYWQWLMPLAIKHDVTYNIAYCLAGSGQVFTAISIDKEETHSDYCETLQRAIAICLILKLQEIQ
jgi:hypothetical protein